MRLVTITAIIAALADQLSKYVVVHVMAVWRVGEIPVLPPLLVFRYGENRGINFGLMGDGAMPAWVLVALALAICAVVAWWLTRQQQPRPALVSAGLLIGGAAGNVIDRLWYGYVLDFLNMSCCGIDNPFVFNVADIFIFAGAIGLAIFAHDGRSAKNEP